MLVLSRKLGQRFQVGQDVRITIVKIDKQSIRIGIEAPGDVTIYREYPAVPVSALPHLGPAGLAAYQSLPEANQCSPHARLDVTQWFDIDAE